MPFRACHFAPAISRLIVSLALLLVCARFCVADPIPWDANAQGGFITGICRDLQGHVWAAGENANGVWSYDPALKLWTHFPPFSDLSGDIYALACDKAGRIWAGGTAGVSVWNGRQWRQYGPTDGPLGTRLFALAVNPKDGGVWGATEAGLFRYQNDAWTYYTRADGLPSDQAHALAFAPDGTLYVGTQCDGLAIGSPADDYKTWRTARGSRQLPNAPAGDGLPSSLINCLLAAPDGAIYCGTDAGLAFSRDHGKTWHFWRGADWRDKEIGLWHGPKPAPDGKEPPALREDYVTALAEDGAGHLLVGHRIAGLEVLNAQTGARLFPAPKAAPNASYVNALLPLRDGTVLEGLYFYGGGLTQQAVPGLTPPRLAASPSLSDGIPPLPSPAKPPTLAELKAMLARVRSLKGTLPVGGGAYLGEDWRTQGDWVGHYGRQYATLCAIASPMDQVLTWDGHYAVLGQMGPHHDPGDSLRHWIQPGRVGTDLPVALYSPVDGSRTQAEWDDHGETYPASTDGPGIWVRVRVPAGVHQLSLYFDETGRSSDPHIGVNDRDYLVELKADPGGKGVETGALPAIDFDGGNPEALPTLARARVVQFWGGVYQQFVVRGPARYLVKIGKNNSWNTMCAGVFMDKLAGPKTDKDKLPAPFTSAIYVPLVLGEAQNTSTDNNVTLTNEKQNKVTLAQTLWAAIDAAVATRQGYADIQPSYRLFAYRVAVASGGTPNLQENWRWRLHFWNQFDHNTFQNFMRSDYQLRTQFPNVATHRPM